MNRSSGKGYQGPSQRIAASTLLAMTWKRPTPGTAKSAALTPQKVGAAPAVQLRTSVTSLAADTSCAAASEVDQAVHATKAGEVGIAGASADLKDRQQHIDRDATFPATPLSSTPVHATPSPPDSAASSYGAGAVKGTLTSHMRSRELVARTAAMLSPDPEYSMCGRWVDKYAPRTVKAVCLADAGKVQLTQWLIARLRGSDDVPNGVVVKGPEGCGKRALVLALCRELDVEVVQPPFECLEDIVQFCQAQAEDTRTELRQRMKRTALLSDAMVMGELPTGAVQHAGAPTRIRRRLYLFCGVDETTNFRGLCKDATEVPGEKDTSGPRDPKRRRRGCSPENDGSDDDTYGHVDSEMQRGTRQQTSTPRAAMVFGRASSSKAAVTDGITKLGQRRQRQCEYDDFGDVHSGEEADDCNSDGSAFGETSHVSSMNKALLAAPKVDIEDTVRGRKSAALDGQGSAKQQGESKAKPRYRLTGGDAREAAAMQQLLDMWQSPAHKNYAPVIVTARNYESNGMTVLREALKAARLKCSAAPGSHSSAGAGGTVGVSGGFGGGGRVGAGAGAGEGEGYVKQRYVAGFDSGGRLRGGFASSSGTGHGNSYRGNRGGYSADGFGRGFNTSGSNKGLGRGTSIVDGRGAQRGGRFATGQQHNDGYGHDRYDKLSNGSPLPTLRSPEQHNRKLPLLQVTVASPHKDVVMITLGAMVRQERAPVELLARIVQYFDGDLRHAINMLQDNAALVRALRKRKDGVADEGLFDANGMSIRRDELGAMTALAPMARSAGERYMQRKLLVIKFPAANVGEVPQWQFDAVTCVDNGNPALCVPPTYRTAGGVVYSMWKGMRQLSHPHGPAWTSADKRRVEWWRDGVRTRVEVDGHIACAWCGAAGQPLFELLRQEEQRASVFGLRQRTTSLRWIPCGDPLQSHMDIADNAGGVGKSHELVPTAYCRVCNACRSRVPLSEVPDATPALITPMTLEDLHAVVRKNLRSGIANVGVKTDVWSVMWLADADCVGRDAEDTTGVSRGRGGAAAVPAYCDVYLALSVPVDVSEDSDVRPTNLSAQVMTVPPVLVSAAAMDVGACQRSYQESRCRSVFSPYASATARQQPLSDLLELAGPPSVTLHRTRPLSAAAATALERMKNRSRGAHSRHVDAWTAREDAAEAGMLRHNGKNAVCVTPFEAAQWLLHTTPADVATKTLDTLLDMFGQFSMTEMLVQQNYTSGLAADTLQHVTTVAEMADEWSQHDLCPGNDVMTMVCLGMIREKRRTCPQAARPAWQGQSQGQGQGQSQGQGQAQAQAQGRNGVYHSAQDRLDNLTVVPRPWPNSSLHDQIRSIGPGFALRSNLEIAEYAEAAAVLNAHGKLLDESASSSQMRKALKHIPKWSHAERRTCGEVTYDDAAWQSEAEDCVHTAARAVKAVRRAQGTSNMCVDVPSCEDDFA